MALQPGQPAPDFKLYNTEKQPVQLSSLKGKNVVLLFFPAAFTSTCTKEMCQTRDELSFYNNMNAEVFGISVDMPFTLAKFKEAEGLNFPLLSDFNKEASGAFGILYQNWGSMELKGVSKRSSFVIDKEGIIRFAEVLENASDYPNLEGVKKTLEGLQ